MLTQEQLMQNPFFKHDNISTFLRKYNTEYLEGNKVVIRETRFTSEFIKGLTHYFNYLYLEDLNVDIRTTQAGIVQITLTYKYDNF